MKEKILLGGYTKRVSKGVYSVLLDSKKAELSALTEVAAVQNPTYITLDQKGTSTLVLLMEMVVELLPLISMVKIQLT